MVTSKNPEFSVRPSNLKYWLRLRCETNRTEAVLKTYIVFIAGYFYCFCWSALLWSIRLLCNLLSLVLIVFMLLLLIGFVDINQLPWCSWFDVSTGVVDGFLSNFLDGVDVGIRSKMVKRNMESHWWGTRIGEERKIEPKYLIILLYEWIGKINLFINIVNVSII